jgi:epoxide hydrolase 4
MISIILTCFVFSCRPSEESDLGTPNILDYDCPVDEARMFDVQLDEVRLNVACRGAGSTTIVFLHGFPEFWYEWDKVMNELAGEYRLIAPDQRGYNLSEKPEEIESYQFEHLIGDIGQLIPKVSSEPVILVAHDWGGPVGWAVASRYPQYVRGFLGANAPHPNRFAELLRTSEEQQEASSYVDWFVTEECASQMEANDFSVLVSFFNGVLTSDDIPVYKAAWGQKGALDGGLNWYRANNFSQLDNEVYSVSIPTMVLWGLDDQALTVPNSEGLEAYVDDLQIFTYENVDHWISHHIPEIIANKLRELDQQTR